MKCNRKTCQYSIDNTSAVLKRGFPDVKGSCADCKSFFKSWEHDYWANPIKFARRVMTKEEQL